MPKIKSYSGGYSAHLSKKKKNNGLWIILIMISVLCYDAQWDHFIKNWVINSKKE